MLAFLFVVAEGKEACVLCVPPPYEVVEGVEQRGKGVPDRTQKLLQAPPAPAPAAVAQVRHARVGGVGRIGGRRGRRRRRRSFYQLSGFRVVGFQGLG